MSGTASASGKRAAKGREGNYEPLGNRRTVSSMAIYYAGYRKAEKGSRRTWNAKVVEAGHRQEGGTICKHYRGVAGP